MNYETINHQKIESVAFSVLNQIANRQKNGYNEKVGKCSINKFLKRYESEHMDK